MNRKKARMIVDIGMVTLLPLLMAYSLIGEQFHEIAGTAMLILFSIRANASRRCQRAALPLFATFCARMGYLRFIYRPDFKGFSGPI